jgi:thymidylate synthase (FAD)
MTKQEQIRNNIDYREVYEHGFVGLTDVFGDDSTPCKTARISYGEGTKSVSDNRNLLRYLVRHKHTTPLEMVVLRFHLKLPIFVMRQHVRHRTAVMNEYSGRYSEMSDEFYVPTHEDISLQSTTNKQGRAEPLADLMEFESKEAAQMIFDACNKVAHQGYRDLLDLGVAREIARIPLGVGNYTECYWQINLHNFFHYSNLRRDSHAQKENRAFADPMFELVERRLPIACEAFNDYIFHAETFSRMEVAILKNFLSSMWVREDLITEEWQKQHGMTKRECSEFIDRLNIRKYQDA